MDPYLWSATGLVFDAFGALLLSVEAVKLNNIMRFRDNVVGQIRDAAAIPIVVFQPNDAHSATVPPGERGDGEAGLGGQSKFYYGIHLISLLALLAVTDLIRRHLDWGPDEWTLVLLWQWSSDWKWVVGVIMTMLIFIVLPFSWLGCWLHNTIEWIANRIIGALVILERATPTGGVGILGALLLIMGFGLQFIGAISSR